jgi:hypothetical protein
MPKRVDGPEALWTRMMDASIAFLGPARQNCLQPLLRYRFDTMHSTRKGTRYGSVGIRIAAAHHRVDHTLLEA